MDIQALAERFGENHNLVVAAIEKTAAKASAIEAKTTSVEEAVGGVKMEIFDLKQRLATRGGGGLPALHKSMGAQVVADERLAEFARGDRNRVRIDIKSLTSAPDSGGALAPPTQIPNPVVPPQAPLRVRSLPSVVRVDSGVVYYPSMVSEDLNPQSVAEGQLKPESFMTFEGVTEEVGTIATWIKVAKQLISDSPVLRSLIDGRLTWAVRNEEDRQLIAGTGTVVAPASGKELRGMLPQATSFVSPVTIPTPTGLDLIRAAITQVQNNNYDPDAIVLNPNDWLTLSTLKDDVGRYVLAEPATAAPLQLFSKPLVVTKSIPAGQFLVGAFKDTTMIWDRQEVAILVSFEAGDSFVRNEAIFLCEERLGFSVLDPLGLVKGTFGGA